MKIMCNRLSNFVIRKGGRIKIDKMKEKNEGKELLMRP